jgi:hypothetical protein
LSQQSQTVFDLPKVLAVGIASPAATVLTSRFGIAGTLLGLALSAVFITAAVDFLKVYLARVPGAVTTIPGGLKKRSSLRGVFERMRLAFSRFASLPRARRRSILIGGVVAAGISFIVGLILVTTLELGVGKNLSCWVWDECSTESSAEGSESAGGASSTLPSILGGGQRAGSSSIPQEEEEASPSNAQEEGPSNLQQQPDYPPGTPKAPSQAPPAPAPANPSAQEEPAQRQGPSGVPDKEFQQQSLPNGAPADQQQPPGSGTPEDQ